MATAMMKYRHSVGNPAQYMYFVERKKIPLLVVKNLPYWRKICFTVIKGIMTQLKLLYVMLSYEGSK